MAAIGAVCLEKTDLYYVLTNDSIAKPPHSNFTMLIALFPGSQTFMAFTW